MDLGLSIEFLRRINLFDDRNFLLSTVKFHGAPVIAGIKPSCLISFTSNSRGMLNIWNRYGNEIADILNIDYFEVYGDLKRKLVLFYNKHVLEETVRLPENLRFLRGFGYMDYPDALEYINMLKSRFSNEFPHEIGIFLGVPYRDVAGFIENSGMNFIINGYWKVYSEPEKAVQIFREYDAARVSVMKSIMDSYPD